MSWLPSVRKGLKVLEEKFGCYLIEIKKKRPFSAYVSGTVELPISDVQTLGIIFVPYFSA